MSKMFNPGLFREFLNLYWLRPENGALMYYQSQSWSDVSISAKHSLDISTGDGTFVFVHCGGRFGMDFDFFQNTLAKRFSHKKFVDIYDSFSRNFRPSIISKPKTKFTYGTDWKKGLVEKAKKLNFFDDVILHDNNILPLPFEDSQFKLVHSNALYWTRNSAPLLQDIHRILDKGGSAVLEFCTPRMLSTLEKLRPFLTPKAFSILDRKRSEEMKVLNADYEHWKRWIKNAGFKIMDVRTAWPNQLITDFWNIGTRPVAHLLIQMAQHLSPKEYRDLKKEWVDIMMEILVPICEKPKRFQPKQAPYITFILEK